VKRQEEVKEEKFALDLLPHEDDHVNEMWKVFVLHARVYILHKHTLITITQRFLVQFDKNDDGTISKDELSLVSIEYNILSMK
jgi:hypothetical protein